MYHLAETVIDNDEWADDVADRLTGTGLSLYYDVGAANYIIVEEE